MKPRGERTQKSPKRHVHGREGSRASTAERLKRRQRRERRRAARQRGPVSNGRPKWTPDARSDEERLRRAFQGIQPLSDEQRYEALARGPRHSVRVKMFRRHRQAVGEGRQP